MRLLVFMFMLLSTAAHAQKSSGGESNPDNELNVFIPNAFTPNADGINDLWRPVVSGPELQTYELMVVDRNGREVFFTTDPSESWTGAMNRGEYISSPSLFIYVLKLRTVGGTEMKTYRGHITMIR